MGDRHRDRADRFRLGLRGARPHPARRGGSAAGCPAGVVQHRQHRDGAAGDRRDRARTGRPGGQSADATGHRRAAAGSDRGGIAAGVLAARCGRHGWCAAAVGGAVGVGPTGPSRRSCCRRSEYRSHRTDHRVRPNSAGVARGASGRAGQKPRRRRAGCPTRRHHAIADHAGSRPVAVQPGQSAGADPVRRRDNRVDHHAHAERPGGDRPDRRHRPLSGAVHLDQRTGAGVGEHPCHPRPDSRGAQRPGHDCRSRNPTRPLRRAAHRVRGRHVQL